MARAHPAAASLLSGARRSSRSPSSRRGRSSSRRRHRRLPTVHAVQHAAHQQRAIGCSRRSAWCRSGFGCCSGRAHLSSEYGPPEIEIAQGFSVAQIPGLAVARRRSSRSRSLLRRRQPVISFGIAFDVHHAASVEQLHAAGRDHARRAYAVPAECGRDDRRGRAPWRRRARWRDPIRARSIAPSATRSSRCCSSPA